MEAAVQESKDIVILIDISKPMNATLDLAKAAAIVVLKTLNPNDRVKHVSHQQVAILLNRSHARIFVLLVFVCFKLHQCFCR